MGLNGVVNIEDLHQLAKKRLPKIAFDFIEGGVEDERALETNRAAFHKHRLLPRYLVDVSNETSLKRSSAASSTAHSASRRPVRPASSGAAPT
jgi:hypothetical protein